MKAFFREDLSVIKAAISTLEQRGGIDLGWPAGKRRNSASGRTEALKRLERYRIREGLSIRGAAKLLSVSDRAVRRWLSGEHWPRQGLIELIRKRCVLSQ